MLGFSVFLVAAVGVGPLPAASHLVLPPVLQVGQLPHLAPAHCNTLVNGVWNGRLNVLFKDLKNYLPTQTGSLELHTPRLHFS